MQYQRLKKQTGVTLLELVIVIVALGILTAPLASGFKIVGEGFGVNRELQMSTGFAQECLELVLALRRQGQWATLDNTTCDVLPAYPAYQEFSTLTRSLVITDVTDATVAACPATQTCKDVHVSVSANGVVREQARVLLVN